jgi:hypothetical protein
MFKKIPLLMLIMAGVFFAGPYTEYCLDQTDPCFQSNCYKVEGSWETNPETGKSDCMYDTAIYSDSQMQSAFATCLAESDRCEQMMSQGQAYSYSSSSGGYTPGGSTSGGSSSGG